MIMSIEQKIELLPCPFCGGEAEVLKYGNDATRRQRSRKTGMMAKCTTRGCGTQKFVGIITHSFEWAEGKVIELWNTRTEQTAELRAEVERLEKREKQYETLLSNTFEISVNDWLISNNRNPDGLIALRRFNYEGEVLSYTHHGTAIEAFEALADSTGGGGE